MWKIHRAVLVGIIVGVAAFIATRVPGLGGNESVLLVALVALVLDYYSQGQAEAGSLG